MTWWLFRRFLFSKRTGALIRLISWLCIFGVGIGVFSLVVVMSVMNGFNKAIRDRMFSAEPHMVVHFKNTEELKKWEAFRPQWLEKNPQAETQLFEEQDVILKTVDGFFGGAQARGLEIEAVREILQNSLEKTGDISEEEFELAPNQIIMGMDLARHLQVYENDNVVVLPPESLLLPAGEVPLVAKMQVQRFVSTFIASIDQGTIYYLRGGSMNRLNSTASFKRGVEIKIADPLRIDSVKKDFLQAGFTAETWIERNSSLFKALKLEKLMIGIFLGLSSLVASFSVITVLALLTTQKKKEFGILMSLGLSVRQTKNLFLKLGLCLSGLGMGGGLALGVLLSLYIERNPLDILPNIYYDSRIPAQVDFYFVMLVGVGALALSVLAAWYPAQKIAKIHPAEAVRAS